jgi:hypothetical protein
LSFILLAAAATAGQTPARKIQALIITGQNGHDWRATTPVLRKLLEDTGRFEVRITEEFRGAGPETLAPDYVAILNYYDSNRPELRRGERADNALLDSCVRAKAWWSITFPRRPSTAGRSMKSCAAGIGGRSTGITPRATISR